ncbi:phosphatidylglycerophosphatase A [Aerococcaceae bacterium DSM 109653]|uniref:Phosphatidylglycerophosphatase A n=1 Tax=Fundicoccus ignavus TaxID=2664442 RepID=A0A6I2GJ36_9LACT|nr:phosphatidylglycerophosphatase A [Fundicoccus ignavus]MRI82735.1 phosphatidylglycerophosphatase A [Fundicoccus ignavus]MRI85289.1 phosphatidylglycerophosphatase A [Fundicoccus ignavus]
MSPNEKLLKQNILRNHAIKLLNDRGVELKDISDIVFDLQKSYVDDLTHEMCLHNVEKVLDKREVQNAVITGIELDIAAESGHLSPVLSDLLMRDEGLYGIDEILCLSIVNVYGSIGLTNFGYVDKIKPGIIGKLNDEKSNCCNTFIDDVVGALAAAAASRIAHAQPQLDDLSR